MSHPIECPRCKSHSIIYPVTGMLCLNTDLSTAEIFKLRLDGQAIVSCATCNTIFEPNSEKILDAEEIIFEKVGLMYDGTKGRNIQKLKGRKGSEAAKRDAVKLEKLYAKLKIKKR